MIRPFIALFLLTFAAPAFAQDKEVEDWSGPYVTVSASGDSQQVRVSSQEIVAQVSTVFVQGRGLVVVPGTTVPVSGSDSKTGFTGGAALGWLGQSGSFVYGVEVSGNTGQSATTFSSSATLPFTALTPPSTAGFVRRVKNEYDWTARVRLGFATGKTLIYATGGVVGTRTKLTATNSFFDPGGLAAPCSPAPCQANFGPQGPVVATSSAKRSLIGWTAGVGLEQKIAKKISIGVDYRHNDYGAKTFDLPAVASVNTGPNIVDSMGNTAVLGGGSPSSARLGLRDDRVGVTLSFHF